MGIRHGRTACTATGRGLDASGRVGAKRGALLVLGLAVAGAVGGFLFGFDSSVVNGAVDAMASEFAMSEALTGFAVAVALLAVPS